MMAVLLWVFCLTAWLAADPLAQELVALKQFHSRLGKVRYNLSYRWYADTLQTQAFKEEQVHYRQWDQYVYTDYGDQKIMIAHPDKYVVINKPGRLILMDQARPAGPDPQEKIKPQDISAIVNKLQEVYNAKVSLQEGASTRCLQVRTSSGDLHRMEYYYNKKNYHPEKLVLLVRRVQVRQKPERNDTTTIFSKIEVRYKDFQTGVESRPEDFPIQDYITRDSAGHYRPTPAYTSYKFINHIK